jgi:hypothetical protein
MPIFGDIKKQISEFMNRLMKDSRKQNLDELLTIAQTWKPGTSSGKYSYDQEMANRLDYFNGSMQSDMVLELKRRFPQTWSEMEANQVNLQLVRKAVLDKAKVFCDTGDLMLVNENNEQITEGKDYDNWEELKRQSHMMATCKQADQYAQLQSRTMVKPWWDTSRRHMRFTVWPTNLVNAVPDPNRWWDWDACYAWLFTLPGADGLNSDARYEVWGVRDPDAANVTEQDTVHFQTSGNADYQYNEKDKNPFVDPRNGRSVYPFVWWQSDDVTSLFPMFNEDMLTINRRVNSQLTDLDYAARFKAYGLYLHKMAENGKPLGLKTLSPSKVVDLEFGAGLENIATNLPITEMWDFVKELVQEEALLGGLSANSLKLEGSAPESGYAQKLRSKPLSEHRANLVEIYRYYVEETGYRARIVHNYYADSSKQINEKLRCHWEPGEIDIPSDPEEVGRVYAAEISSNVSTPADWRMVRYDEDKKAAEKAVMENAEFNKASTSKGNVPPQFGGDADAVADQLFARNRIEEPDEDEEQEETEET